MTISTNGNVGIGTTAPYYKLDVNDQMRSNGFHHHYADNNDYVLLAGGGYMIHKTGATTCSTAIQIGKYVWVTIQTYVPQDRYQIIPDNISKPTKRVYIYGGNTGGKDHIWYIDTDGTLHILLGDTVSSQLFTTVCYVVS